jgi:hypothetical protein
MKYSIREGRELRFCIASTEREDHIIIDLIFIRLETNKVMRSLDFKVHQRLVTKNTILRGKVLGGGEDPEEEGYHGSRTCGHGFQKQPLSCYGCSQQAHSLPIFESNRHMKKKKYI